MKPDHVGQPDVGQRYIRKSWRDQYCFHRSGTCLSLYCYCRNRRRRGPFEQVPFNHPWLTVFSSGTTGLPKSPAVQQGDSASAVPPIPQGLNRALPFKTPAVPANSDSWQHTLFAL